ncbi:hypothetical protein NDU88_010003 [Pleurodeles waltl]|uniref:Uncharacterized protein n=1 Tax=Pleurodeles waltl TaxID=8319 RepID=A0AAV7QZ26_PLEWA|nr:hypothetical protein NDU88_010003 [Pleurodeles waltl]
MQHCATVYDRLPQRCATPALLPHDPIVPEADPDDGVVAAVEPVDSNEDEAEEEENDNRESVIQQYFQ